MNAVNIYRCTKCNKHYIIPCLFVVESQRKGIENKCPDCKTNTGKIFKSDIYPETLKNKYMSLSYVAEPADEVGKLFKSKAEREAAKRKRQENRQENKDERKERRKRQGSRVGKIALAPARAAFLVVVSVNGLNLAKKLEKAWKKDKSKVISFWIKFSGKENALKEAIEKGSKAQLGVVVAAGVLATAVPIIIKVGELLKGLGFGDDEEINDGIDAGLKEIEINPDFEKDYTNEYVPKDNVGVVKADGGTGQTKPATAPAPDEGKNTGMLIGVAALLFLLSQ